MSSLFAPRGSSDNPWFRLGRLEVGTVMAVVLIVAVSWVASIAVPSLPGALAFMPDAVGSGQVWRLVTWPLANAVSLWSVLNLFFFWYFGTDLENTIGRSRMLGLLVGTWASLTAASALVGVLLRGGTGLAGIGLIQFAVLLLWIAEYPRRPFFFGIPAWVIGLVLVGVQVASLLTARAGASLLSLLFGFALIAVAARRAGLLGEYGWIPGGRRPARVRAPKVPRAQARAERRTMSDRERLDALLDRINEDGLNGLTEAERRELLRLRDRLRGS